MLRGNSAGSQHHSSSTRHAAQRPSLPLKGLLGLLGLLGLPRPRAARDSTPLNTAAVRGKGNGEGRKGKGRGRERGREKGEGDTTPITASPCNHSASHLRGNDHPDRTPSSLLLSGLPRPHIHPTTTLLLLLLLLYRSGPSSQSHHHHHHHHRHRWLSIPPITPQTSAALSARLIIVSLLILPCRPAALLPCCSAKAHQQQRLCGSGT